MANFIRKKKVMSVLGFRSQVEFVSNSLKYGINLPRFLFNTAN